MPDNTDIALYDRMSDPIQAIDRMGEWFARSGMFGLERVEQGKILALACMSERKSPIQLAREYHIIEGHLSDRADSILAKFRSRGGRHKIITRTADEAAVALTIEGQTLTFRLTWEEAQKEPFVWRSDGKLPKTPKKNWATPRARMQTLWARVISDGVRTMAPEIVSGIYTPEEIDDEISAPAQRLIPSSPVAPASEVQPAIPTPHSLQDSLLKVFGDEDAHCRHWLVEKGWIPSVEDLADISPRRALQILERPEAFLGAVRKWIQATQEVGVIP